MRPQSNSPWAGTVVRINQGFRTCKVNWILNLNSDYSLSLLPVSSFSLFTLPFWLELKPGCERHKKKPPSLKALHAEAPHGTGGVEYHPHLPGVEEITLGKIGAGGQVAASQGGHPRCWKTGASACSSLPPGSSPPPSCLPGTWTPGLRGLYRSPSFGIWSGCS